MVLAGSGSESSDIGGVGGLPDQALSRQRGEGSRTGARATRYARTGVVSQVDTTAKALLLLALIWAAVRISVWWDDEHRD